MAVLSKPMVALLSTLALMAIVRRFGLAAVRRARSSSALVPSSTSQGDKGRADKVGVSAKFLLELLRLLRICVPSVLSPEAGIAALVAALMVARTAADIFMIDVQTSIEASIISRDAAGFSSHLGRFIGAFLPVALINNVMKYAVKELQMRMRERLTRHLVDKYMSGAVYAQVAAIDSRLANADQLIVQDVERFTTSVADLFTNVTKPTLDIALYCYRLGSTVGWAGPALMAAYLTLSGGVLTWLRAPSAQLTASEQRLEGQYRHVHSRVIAHAEEIAFLQGGARERAGILRAFDALISHVRSSQRFRYLVGTVDTMLAKYAATVVGFYVVSRPFLAAGGTGVGALRNDRSLVEQYYTSGRQLLNLATAIGRLVLAGRDMARLAGFTQRITTLTAVLDDLRSGHYVRTMVAGAPPAAAGAPLAVEDGPPTADGSAALAAPLPPPPPSAPERRPLMSPDALLVEVEGGDAISFTGVPLRTPNGDVLLRSLDLTVRAGMNTLIAGPNGCGKSSFFRVLRGLWPQFGGRIERPPLAQLLYIPQRPYLTLGSLRDQITYPLSAAEVAAAGRGDADVAAVLQDAHLQPILARVGGLDAVLDWADVLSGGEKQRVGFARLLFHRPKFAILDECSSAVSVDVEGQLYERCRALGITLFSVSHRRSLWRHHEFLLRFDGQGGYEFRPMMPEDTGEGAWGS